MPLDGGSRGWPMAVSSRSGGSIRTRCAKWRDARDYPKKVPAQRGAGTGMSALINGWDQRVASAASAERAVARAIMARTCLRALLRELIMQFFVASSLVSARR